MIANFTDITALVLRFRRMSVEEHGVGARCGHHLLSTGKVEKLGKTGILTVFSSFPNFQTGKFHKIPLYFLYSENRQIICFVQQPELQPLVQENRRKTTRVPLLRLGPQPLGRVVGVPGNDHRSAAGQGPSPHPPGHHAGTQAQFPLPLGAD
jgi:hypothetical protein